MSRAQEINALGPIVMTVAEIGEFLLEHGDVIQAAASALAGGLPKEALMQGIRASMLAASDLAMTEVLGPRPSK